MGMRANNPQLKIDLTVFGISAAVYMLLFISLSVFYLHRHEMAAC
jgi:hypothetical protein